MPSIPISEAAEKVAEQVGRLGPSHLIEVYAELHPTRPVGPAPSAEVIAQQIRDGLEAEEIVDLWNVVFPRDRHVQYNEETGAICYNEDPVGSLD